MWKKLLAMVSVGVLACALFGCSSSNDSSASSASDTGSSAATDSSSSAAAGTEDKVVVYSTHPEKLLEKIADDFKADTGIEVEFINLKGELADRVESEIGNPQADVMYGGDISVYMQLAEKGAYEATNPSWADSLSSEFKAADGTWYSTIKTPVMMFYNTEKLDEANAPKDWTDLTDAKYKDQIVSRDYLSSSMRSAVCNLIYYFDKDKGGMTAAEEFLAGFDANVKSYYNSGSMMFQAIGTGEASVGISTLNDIIDNATNNDMPLKQINATSGNVIVSDCVAALKDCKHPEAAAKFVEYVGSVDVEVMLANDFNRMPANPEALEKAPEWMRESLNVLPNDWSVIAKNQSDWLALWQESLYTEEKTVASN